MVTCFLDDEHVGWGRDPGKSVSSGIAATDTSRDFVAPPWCNDFGESTCGTDGDVDFVRQVSERGTRSFGLLLSSTGRQCRGKVSASW